MRTEDSTISLTCMEAEILIAALTRYEIEFRTDRSQNLTEQIRALRAKLLTAA
jgi:hypothetical protein